LHIDYNEAANVDFDRYRYGREYAGETWQMQAAALPVAVNGLTGGGVWQTTRRDDVSD